MIVVARLLVDSCASRSENYFQCWKEASMVKWSTTPSNNNFCFCCCFCSHCDSRFIKSDHLNLFDVFNSFIVRKFMRKPKINAQTNKANNNFQSLTELENMNVNNKWLVIIKTNFDVLKQFRRRTVSHRKM